MKYIKSFESIEFSEKLISVTPNRFVYHKSNPFFRDNISEEGLTPKGKSETWLSDTKINSEVIFATNSDNPDDWFNSTWDDDIYKIDTRGLKNQWFKDPNFTNGHHHIITPQSIPNSAIKLIYKGSGKSNF